MCVHRSPLPWWIGSGTYELYEITSNLTTVQSTDNLWRFITTKSVEIWREREREREREKEREERHNLYTNLSIFQYYVRYFKYLHWERCAYYLIGFSEDREEERSVSPYRKEGGSECGKEVAIEEGSVGRRWR